MKYTIVRGNTVKRQGAEKNLLMDSKNLAPIKEDNDDIMDDYSDLSSDEDEENCIRTHQPIRKIKIDDGRFDGIDTEKMTQELKVK